MHKYVQDQEILIKGLTKLYKYHSYSSSVLQIYSHIVINYRCFLFFIGMMMGDDPHFSVVLPSDKLLCFSVQGNHGFSYNLISNRVVHMNAIFVPDSRRKEVTWIGTLGILVSNSSEKRLNKTSLMFDVKTQKIVINNKVKLTAKSIGKITLSNGKLSISEAHESRYPEVFVNLVDVNLRFSVVFKTEHLDMFWHSTGQQIEDSHGLIGMPLNTLLQYPSNCILPDMKSQHVQKMSVFFLWCILMYVYVQVYCRTD